MCLFIGVQPIICTIGGLRKGSSALNGYSTVTELHSSTMFSRGKQLQPVVFACRASVQFTGPNRVRITLSVRVRFSFMTGVRIACRICTALTLTGTLMILILILTALSLCISIAIFNPPLLLHRSSAMASTVGQHL